MIYDTPWYKCGFYIVKLFYFKNLKRLPLIAEVPSALVQAFFKLFLLNHNNITYFFSLVNTRKKKKSAALLSIFIL